MPSTEFLLTSLVVVLIPGTGVINTISNGLFLGWRASIAAACGCTAGILPHITARILGLSAILHMSAVSFKDVKYLAWTMWRETGGLKFDTPATRKGLYQIAVRGFLINILNPKLSIFFLAFLPLFVNPQAVSPTMDMMVLSATFMAMTLVIFILYGISAHSVRRYVVGSPRIISRLQRSFAGVFAALGIKLALTDQ